MEIGRLNFYKHFIGDFQRDTSHLSLTERGAYLALMHHYYATEQALPMDHAALCRIASAFSKPERDAVRAAMKFFEQRDGALWHKRIEAELEKSEGKSDTNRRIALEREARKRAEKLAQTHHETCTNRGPNVAETLHEQSTPQNHSQSSLRSEEEKTPRKRATPLPRPEDVAEQIWNDWCALRKAKRATVTETVVAEARTEAAKASLTLERFFAVWCARGSQGLQADWLKPNERGQQGTGETDYQRSMRERVEQFAPDVAARAPGQSRPLTFIEEIQDVPAIASR